MADDDTRDMDVQQLRNLEFEARLRDYIGAQPFLSESEVRLENLNYAAALLQRFFVGDQPTTSATAEIYASIETLTTMLNEIASFIDIHRTAEGLATRVGRLVAPDRIEALTSQIDETASAYKIDFDLGQRTIVSLARLVYSWIDSEIPELLHQYDLSLALRDIQLDVGPMSAQALARYRNEQVAGLQRQAFKTVENLKEAAGEGGRERLAQTFETRGKEEATSASDWNKLVMVFVTLGIVLPLVAISLGDHFLGQLSDTYALVVKALIGLPMFFMATYAGRISAQHRKLSQHMKTLTAQIDSVRAYAEPLSPDQRQDLIATLGKRAFSEPGVTTPGEGSVGMPPEDIRPILEKAIEALKPDKNDKK
ncbi:hypothetical protein [Mycolicibacterium fluoranthenivorans]|uniref:Uncharacterized protein n=1 Tax=Mycolicibacterium fluoranthenivorans TaxID=258505 RepID=A0A1G4WZG8_9MYCO|nr:hypothetical protein [Mycolicibacterium fluoranthenivorans]SCX32926.1 hypothetical protein SAMN02799620_05746 [Mycolicibacterium fluoranthenivorans]